MLMFWKEKLVLLAVPKTGSTALEEALLPHADAAILNPPQMKHVTVRRYRTQLAPFFERRGAHRPMELMAIVREPVSWLGSWYRYRARPQLIGSATSTNTVSFESFVEAWLSDPVPDYARVGRQSRFVGGSDGAMGVDRLFAYERFDAAVGYLEARLDRALDVPRRNVSPSASLDLSKAMLDRLRVDATPEFELWDRAMDRDERTAP